MNHIPAQFQPCSSTVLMSKVFTSYHCENGRIAQKHPGVREPLTLQVWRWGCMNCHSHRGCPPWQPASVQNKYTIIIAKYTMCIMRFLICQSKGCGESYDIWSLTGMWAFPSFKLNWTLLVLPSNRGRILLLSSLEFFIKTTTFPSRSCPAGFPCESWN